eukprot:gene1656-1809_t
MGTISENSSQKPQNWKPIEMEESSGSGLSSSLIYLRRANHDDVDLIMVMIKEVVSLLNAEGNFQWNDGYPLASDFAQDIDKSELWLAIDPAHDNEIVGVGALTKDQYDEYADVGYDLNDLCIVPHRIAVRPSARGQGIAQLILLHGEKLAREEGIALIRVDTNAKNSKMRRIFEKLGYSYGGDVVFKHKPVVYETMKFSCYQKKL